MGYAGRAVLTDPDIFALADITCCSTRDMGGAAVLARQMPADSRRPLHYASSVMLLDCARLAHWRWEEDFDETFRGERDYRDWMWLLLEPPGAWRRSSRSGTTSTGSTPETRLLHNTHRRTQPWKTGLPSDFTPRGTTLSSRAGIWLRRLRGKGDGPLSAPSRSRPGAHLLQAARRVPGQRLGAGVAARDRDRARPHPHRRARLHRPGTTRGGLKLRAACPCGSAAPTFSRGAGLRVGRSPR